MGKNIHAPKGKRRSDLRQARMLASKIAAKLKSLYNG